MDGLTTAYRAFWSADDPARQHELIAGPVAWAQSVAHAPEEWALICPPAIHRMVRRMSGGNPVVLEWGCGLGRVLSVIDIPCRRIGVDLSPAMLDGARAVLTDDVALLPTEGTHVDLPDASVDFCYSYLVLQHVPTRAGVQAILRELARVTRPGGWLRVQTMCGPAHDVETFGGFHGAWYPNAATLIDDVRAAGYGRITVDVGLRHPDWLWVSARKGDDR